MATAPLRPHDGAFVRTRRVVFGIVLASFVLSFFHRTAPAAIAGELTRAFSINAAVLGTLAATYFYVYTLLQIPVGVLADTLGPRRILAGGSLVAAAGSLLFALAPAWELAAAGRTLVGIGVAVAFIAILKISAVWFPANRFATLNGVTMFAGNLGAVIAGAPLAWLVTQTSWRAVFVALALLSAALGIATWLMVRDRPQDRGFAPVTAPAAAGTARVAWTAALARVLANPATWPGFFVNVGIGGSYLAFAGLWAVPWLVETHGMERVTAAQHGSLLLLGVAFGSLVVGIVSDRLGSRRGVMRAYAFLYALSWLPWLLHVEWPLAATLALVLRHGPAHSGLHAVVDGGQGSEPSRAFRHRDLGRQRRDLPRHRHPAAAGGLGARPRSRRRRRRRRVGPRDAAAGGCRGAGRAGDAHRPRSAEAGRDMTAPAA